MNRILSIFLIAAMALSLAACDKDASVAPTVPVTDTYADAVHIELSDGMTAAPAGVTLSHDIVYYEAGRDFTYGEGTEADAHTPEEAAAHTVVTITEAGDYLLTGKLSAGQIAVDLGEDAESDPNAVVTLIFGGADITCTVAPAVIFYNVYECADTDNPTKDVDTSAAGANVIIAAGTENTVSGSHVARIYKSVELSEDGTEVIDSKKLHKYDGAFYSKMSMNIGGDGLLAIYADNEGLDSEMHLTVNGGEIYIHSGNDGINTNEDGVSVTTVNGGLVNIVVNGSTGEGDGIDSNGWLVINGGTVIAQACATSGDAGIDSDMGIYLNGGTVLATGNMLDRIAGGSAAYAVFQSMQPMSGDKTVALKNADGEAVAEWYVYNDFGYLIIADPAMTEGEYSLWHGDERLQVMDGMQGMGGGREQMQRPEGMEPPEGFDREQMQRPEGMEPPEGFDREQLQRPEGMERPDDMGTMGEGSDVFTIVKGGNMFAVM